MHISHHIAQQLVAERQRDLLASRHGWRVTDLFRASRRSAELEPVPPRRTDAVGAGGPARLSEGEGAAHARELADGAYVTAVNC
jgi:hypothetical protein